MLRVLIIAFILVFSTLGAVMAAPVTYSIDQRHTNIMWFASHFGFSKSMGQFMDFNGKIIFDYDNPTQSKVGIIINTDSITTGLPKFDDHLKSADFFDVTNHPKVIFKVSPSLTKNVS